MLLVFSDIEKTKKFFNFDRAGEPYPRRQHYPPDSFGFQNIFKEFPTSNDVTKNGKELYYPKGGRGLEGSETAERSQPGSRFVALREPGVPPARRPPCLKTSNTHTLHWVMAV